MISATNSRATNLLFAVICLQLVTVAMVGYLFFKVYRVSTAFGELQKAFAPTPPATEAQRPARRPFATAAASEPTVAPQSQPDPSLQVAATTDTSFDVVSVDHKLIDSNDSFYKFSWQVTVRNNSDGAKRCDGRVLWLDSSQFVVASANTGVMNVAPHETATFSGWDLVSPTTVGATVRAARAQVGC